MRKRISHAIPGNLWTILGVGLFLMGACATVERPPSTEPVVETANWHENAFFGLHYDLHANLNDTELGRMTTYEHIKEELTKVNPDFVQYDCKGHPGVTGYPTRIGTPSPGIQKDALKIWREVTRDMGIPLSVHYSGIWDNAVLVQHPEWARTNADGSKSERHVCAQSAYTTEFMIPQLLEVIDEYDVDGFWIDGENWASLPCYGPECKKNFTEETGITDIPAKKDEPNWRAWADFHRGLFEQHVRLVAEAVHARKPECLVCSNWMYSVRQPDPVTVPVDYLSGDFTPSFGCERACAEARFIAGRGMPWDLMAWSFFRTGDQAWTMKSAEHLCQEVSVVLANGGAVFIYNQPQRNGHLVGWHQDIFAEVARFCRARQAYSQHTQGVPQVAILHSQSHYYSANRSLYDLGNAHKPMEGALHALLECGYSVELLNEESLMERMADYPLVVIPEQTHLPPALSDELERYVRGGGRLLMSGTHLAEAHGGLLGVAALEGQRGQSYLPANGGVVIVGGAWKNVRATDAVESAALYSGQEIPSDKAGTPAATLRTLGDGRIAAIHGPVFDNYWQAHYPRLRAFIADRVRELAPPALGHVDGPASVEVSLREKGDWLLVHLVNRGANPSLDPRRHGVEAVPPVGPLTVRVPCPKKPNKVTMAPENKRVRWSWQDGWLHATVPEIGIYEVMVIERD